MDGDNNRGTKAANYSRLVLARGCAGELVFNYTYGVSSRTFEDSIAQSKLTQNESRTGPHVSVGAQLMEVGKLLVKLRF